MSDQQQPDSPADGGKHRTHPSLAAGLGAAAHRVENIVEERLEHGIEVAEETIARRFGLGALRAVRATLRYAFWTLVAAYFAFGALLLVTRYYVLPRIDQWRPQVEDIASRALNGQVRIGRITAGWRGFNPHLSLNDVQVTGPRGGPPLALPRADATFSWLSLVSMQPRFAALRLMSPEVSVVRLVDGNFTVAGFAIERGKAESDESPALDWLLSQKLIVVRDGHVVYRDDRGEAPLEFELNDVNLIVRQSLGSHGFALSALPTADFAGPIDLRGSIATGAFARPSDVRQWSGEGYLQLDFVDLAQLARVAPLPVQIEQAYGALRAWMTLENGQVVRTTADVALQDVSTRLAKELEPLHLASLQGRITQREWNDVWPGGRRGQEFGLIGTTFRTAAGLTFPPIDVKVRRAVASAGAPESTEVEASRIDLESLAALLAHLPLPSDLNAKLARHALRGTLSALSLAWNGATPTAGDMALKAKFNGLSSAAQPAAGGSVGLPGVENLSGAVRMDKGSGTLELASSDAVVVFPGVFEEPRMAFRQLLGTVQWRQGAALELRADSLRASNDDVDVTASGTYRTAEQGPGTIDLTGRIVRASAASAYRYAPLTASDHTRKWLRHALVGGRLADGTFRLRGALDRFPFVNPAEGEFRAAGRVLGATLDVYPAAMREEGRAGERGAIWPVLSDIDADLVFDRASVTIQAQRGRALGARIEQATAHIPSLWHDTTLDMKAQVTGPLAELVRYVNGSPVRQLIGGITDGAETQGTVKLDLGLLMPLGDAANTRVTGAITFQNNAVTLAGLPPFSRTNGTLGFNERGVRANNLTTTVAGGPARIDASTRADGALVFSASGTATPAGLRGIAPVAPVQRLLDRSSGSVRYQAMVVVKDGGSQLRVDSDLVGLAIDGIAPLRKATAESLPLRVEHAASAGSDSVRVELGRAVAVRIERAAANGRGDLRLTRGVVALNEAPNLPERGLLVIAALPRLDVGAWSNLLMPDTPAATRAALPPASGEEMTVDLVALRTDELVVQGHSVRNLTLGATRQPDGSYAANVASDGVTGFIGWRPATDPQALGQITARLSRLVIPARKEQEVIAVLRAPPRQIPALEISVEQFELSGMKLGQLDLVAQNVGSGAGGVWRVRRFDVTNPDMKLVATGEWGPAPTGGNRRTQLKFAIDASDGGAALARLGYPDALAGSTGRVEGEVTWLGSPLDIDYPTLSGRVSLSADDGRFLKVDAGNAARLLALLSLQSLGRNLAADGGAQFAEGFAFTSIRADASLDRGVLRTDNFRMNGASAAVLMSGTLDLRNETQQLSIVVLPQIDATTAALAVGVVNPLFGLGTFLAQLVLRDPLSKAFALQYDVSGSWTDPKITRRQRIAPDPTTEAAK